MFPEVKPEESTVFNRNVWVLNSDSVSYTEEFNGETIVVPPNNEKKVQMPYLEARRFLGRGRPPGEQDHMGNWIVRPKALRTEEISPVRAQDFDAATEASEHRCQICSREFGSLHGLKIHVSTQHPNAEKAKSE